MSTLDDLKLIYEQKSRQIAKLRAQQESLAKTIEMLSEDAGSGVSEIIHQSKPASIKKNSKTLILEEVASNPGITRAQVQANFEAKGVDVNPNTLSTTLSKLVGKELEKLGDGYRLKGESPVAAGLSSATESDGS